MGSSSHSRSNGFRNSVLDLDRPLYTALEAEERIREIDDLIFEIQKLPASASAAGVGSAHFLGRLSDLRKERAVWIQKLEESRNFEQKERDGISRSRMQGPRQILE